MYLFSLCSLDKNLGISQYYQIISIGKEGLNVFRLITTWAKDMRTNTKRYLRSLAVDFHLGSPQVSTFHCI